MLFKYLLLTKENVFVEIYSVDDSEIIIFFASFQKCLFSLSFAISDFVTFYMYTSVITNQEYYSFFILSFPIQQTTEIFVKINKRIKGQGCRNTFWIPWKFFIERSVFFYSKREMTIISGTFVLLDVFVPFTVKHRLNIFAFLFFCISAKNNKLSSYFREPVHRNYQKKLFEALFF